MSSTYQTKNKAFVTRLTKPVSDSYEFETGMKLHIYWIHWFKDKGSDDENFQILGAVIHPL